MNWKHLLLLLFFCELFMFFAPLMTLKFRKYRIVVVLQDSTMSHTLIHTISCWKPLYARQSASTEMQRWQYYLCFRGNRGWIFMI